MRQFVQLEVDAKYTSCRSCGGAGLIRVVWEMPEKLAEEADFTLNGVDDVGRFLRWLSQTAVELN